MKESKKPKTTPKIEVLVPKDDRLYAINKLALAIATLASALSCSTQVTISHCTVENTSPGPGIAVKTVTDQEYTNLSQKFVRES